MSKSKKAAVIAAVSVAALLVAVLIGLICTGAFVGWGPFDGLFWGQEVKRIQKRYPAEEYEGGIVFYGASNFRLWTEMEQDMPEYRVANCGFGGSTDKLMVEYAEELLYPYGPSIVFFQTGSNDYVEMSGSDEEKVGACMEYKEYMFTTFHERLPEAKFIVMSGLLLPGRSEYTSLTQKVNDALKELCEKYDYMTFVDAEEMTFDGENYAEELFVSDGIHLDHEGQLLWRDKYILPAIENVTEKYGLEQAGKR